ncbi:MAG: hypothetical protein LBG82_08645 [Clostridiales Family XIII bacterium]|nr:hypothetical protein [Clostridiales Family XIII bacterium]
MPILYQKIPNSVSGGAELALGKRAGLGWVCGAGGVLLHGRILRHKLTHDREHFPVSLPFRRSAKS